MFPSSFPECNKYSCDYSYSFTNARCFCKCAGDSDWSQYVRGCLRHYYNMRMNPTKAHALCYLYGTMKHGAPPVATLTECVINCSDIPFDAGGHADNNYFPPL
jgi:hypothetical protein